MAVQAQYPSNMLVPDFRNRARKEPVTKENRICVFPCSAMPSPTLGEDIQLQPNLNAAANLFRACNSGLNFRPNGCGAGDPESELTCNVSGSRKRTREELDFLVAQREQLNSLVNFQQNNVRTVLVSLPQAPGLVSTGLVHLNYGDGVLNQPVTSTSGRTTNLGTNDLTAWLIQEQKDEIEHFIMTESEKLRTALEEKRQRHCKALVATIDQGIVRKLKEKEADLEKLNRRNAELEQHVKQLSMESQIWQKVAKDNEAMVVALKSNLEQSREGWGDSEADDAQSCCYDDTSDVRARALKENKQLKEQRSCRLCRSNRSCILLLPCRHLCLCKDCETMLNTCPLCKSMKKASVQVYMS